MPQLPPRTTCATATVNRQSPLAHPYRRFMHKHSHTVFTSSTPPTPLACICCDVAYEEIFQCASCDLKLCVICKDTITTNLIRGDLRRLVAHSARWKLGYSTKLLEREQREKQVSPDRPVVGICHASGSGLRLELKPWMLWAEEDGLESDASDDSVYSDGSEMTVVPGTSSSMRWPTQSTQASRWEMLTKG